MTQRNDKKSGFASPALLLGLTILIASAVGALALDFVNYSDPDTADNTWSDTNGGTLTVSNIVVGGSTTLPANGIAAADIGVIVQSDTNATTTVSAYTPDFIGQALMGNTGGTNYIWMAYGATTNDWKQVHP